MVKIAIYFLIFKFWSLVHGNQSKLQSQLKGKSVLHVRNAVFLRINLECGNYVSFDNLRNTSS